MRAKSEAAKAAARERVRRYAQTPNARRMRAARLARKRERLKIVDEVIDDTATPNR
jgi:hypothetical protein